MKIGPAVSLLASRVDLAAVAAEAADMLDGGLTADEVVEFVARRLDELLPLDAILPAPLGALAEAMDGPAYRALGRVIVTAIQGARARTPGRVPPADVAAAAAAAAERATAAIRGQ